MASFEDSLPIEQWWQVLANLPPKDLCNVVLTSICMNIVASLPELWAGMKVNMEKVRENGLTEFYNISRFKKVRKMDLVGIDFTSDELERLMKDIPGSPLEEVDLNDVKLFKLPAKLLSRMICGLKTVNLAYTDLTTGLCVKILESSLTSNTLANLGMENIKLRGVPAELLSRAIGRLENVSLVNTRLRTKHSVKVLEEILSSNTLAYVNLGYNNLSQVPGNLLAKAVCRLQSIRLSHTQLTTEQCVQVLKSSLSSKALVGIDLKGINLSGVDYNLLATAVSRLERVRLSKTQLTAKHCSHILCSSLSSKTLVDMNLGYVNLSEVSGILLTKAVSRLKTARLPGTKLSTDQCVEVLKTSFSSQMLVGLDLSCVDLSGVPADILAKGVCCLQSINLSYTQLTTEQTIQVLEGILASNKLVNGDLQIINQSELPDGLVERVVQRLESVNLDNSKHIFNKYLYTKMPITHSAFELLT